MEKNFLNKHHQEISVCVRKSSLKVQVWPYVTSEQTISNYQMSGNSFFLLSFFVACVHCRSSAGTWLLYSEVQARWALMHFFYFVATCPLGNKSSTAPKGGAGFDLHEAVNQLSRPAYMGVFLSVSKCWESSGASSQRYMSFEHVPSNRRGNSIEEECHVFTHAYLYLYLCFC